MKSSYPFAARNIGSGAPLIMMFSFSTGQTDSGAASDAQTASEIDKSVARNDVGLKIEQLHKG